MEAKNSIKKLELCDRIDYLGKSKAYITLKDHKENFVSKLTCGLINPAKRKNWKIRKKLIEKMNVWLLEKLRY